MTTMASEKPDPILLYLAHLVGEWLVVEKGRTQDQLADLAGVSRPTISKLKGGTEGLSLELLRRVGKALGKETLGELESEAEAWFAEEEQKRAKEQARAKQSKLGVVKGRQGAPSPHLVRALEMAGKTVGESPDVRETLTAVSQMLPCDLRVATWFSVIEDMLR